MRTHKTPEGNYFADNGKAQIERASYGWNLVVDGEYWATFDRLRDAVAAYVKHCPLSIEIGG